MSKVTVRSIGEKLAQAITAGAEEEFSLVADEPVDIGGENSGSSPYELLLAALGSCMSMTMRMYARRKQWPLEKVEIELTHQRVNAKDCDGCEGRTGLVDQIWTRTRIFGDLRLDGSSKRENPLDRQEMPRSRHFDEICFDPRGPQERKWKLMNNVNLKKVISSDVETAVNHVSEELKSQGFGILNRIDLHSKIKEKTKHELRPVVILGACNPELAYEAYSQNPDVASLLPCNAVIRDLGEGQISVELARPTALMEMLGDAQLVELARDADKRLEKALAAI